MSTATSHPPLRRIHRLPLTGVLRLGTSPDIWFKRSWSVAISAAIPVLTLLALDRLDLAMYTMAGSFCALYAHDRPYAVRARALFWVVVGMGGGLAVALVTASLTSSAVVLVTVGAVLAAVQKILCDATRLGPPGNVIFTFVSSAALFAPQTLGQVPGHVALALGAGVVSWLIGMAPALVRPHGPERRATAHALNAAAAYADTKGTGPGQERARSAGAAAVHAAWESLMATGERTAARRALELLVVRAEVALAAPTATDAGQLRAWAKSLRGSGSVPRPPVMVGAADELLGVDAEAAGAKPSLWHRIGPGSPLLPIALRCAIGCAVAGYVSLALGIGRPYWAIVTAASLYQANVTLTWKRGVQRVVGNLVGVLLFALIVPVAHLGPAALVVCFLVVGWIVEWLMGRNYWLGSAFVTPMALLITEFGQVQQTGELVSDRVVDTLVGALFGMIAAIAVTNRRAGDRIERALVAADRAREHAQRTLADPHPAPGALEAARRGLVAAVVALRDAADAAAGEWWQRALPMEQVVLAEQAGHRTLAALVRRQGLHASEGART
ncbi:FUSC family protein [Streptomyces jeddahensis]|uniref:Fusaric acid resistance protein family protein n=1 Tax=Streptomyces jeddahensis TaxID=1716141 RepID=A0A177HIJ8_9ACTN|nr:FUSC family protein [Streptomyces jeddahensis]OAH10439.1 fusaric acid resistance protein family protein [Streptomyces jeddahensis]